MKFGTDVQVPLRMKYSYFGHPQSFDLEPPSDHNLNWCNTVLYNQIPAK